MRVLALVVFILCGYARLSYAQTSSSENFADSVVRVLSASKQPAHILAAESFKSFYNQAPEEISRMVRQQTAVMRRNQYKLRPDILLYFQTVVWLQSS